MAAIFLVASVAAFIWSAFKYQAVYYALIDSFPLQFRRDPSTEFAFHALALSSSTALSLQADYVKSLAGFCVAFLCLSLFVFSFQVNVGFLFLALTFVCGVSTFRYWMTYKQNCNRAVAHDDKDQS